VPRLAPRALLALAEAAGQRGERRGQPVPGVPGVRVGAGVQQQPGRLQRVDLRHPGVGQVEQRLPAVRAGRRRRHGWVGEVGGQGRRVAGRRGRRHRAGRQVGLLGQQRRRGRPPVRAVLRGVDQAGEPAEVVGRVGDGRHRVRVAAVAGEQLELPAQRRPGGEAALPGDHELRGGEREVGSGREVVPADQCGGLRIAGADRALQLAGLPAEVLDGRVVGQAEGGHADSSRTPAVREAGPKGAVRAVLQAVLRWVEPFPRTGGALRAHSEVNAPSAGLR